MVRSNNSFKVEDAGWIAKLTTVLDEFRKVHQDITANHMLVLLYIGLTPGITQKELSQLVGLNDGTVSRICAIMSDRGLRDRAGLGLIEIKFGEDDYRTRGQALTAKGRRVFESIRKAMEGK